MNLEAKRKRIENYGYEFGVKGHIELNEFIKGTNIVTEEDIFTFVEIIDRLFVYHKKAIPNYLIDEDLEDVFINSYIRGYKESRGL